MLSHRSWTITKQWLGTPAAEAFSSLDKVFALTGETAASDSESLTFRLEIDGSGYYVKRYHTTKGLRSWLGRARIHLEARNQLWFNELKLPAARVVAYGQERILSKTTRGALITAAVENTTDLASLATHQPHYLSSKPWVAQILAQLAMITRTLHDQQFCHNDLKWRNILVTLDPDSPQIFLIDCPVGQRWFRPFLRHRIIKDLACLDKVAKHKLSRTLRLHFYKLYKQTDKLSATDKQQITEILRFFNGRE
jgi:tRNA A-37 threonylcarbamoyl transferase component Bud32